MLPPPDRAIGAPTRLAVDLRRSGVEAGWLLGRRLPRVDHQRVTRHEARLVAREIEQRVRDVVGVPRDPERRDPADGGLGLLEGELQAHHPSLLPLKVDRDLAAEQIPIHHFSRSPRLVKTKAAWSHLREAFTDGLGNSA